MVAIRPSGPLFFYKTASHPTPDRLLLCMKTKGGKLSRGLRDVLALFPYYKTIYYSYGPLSRRGVVPEMHVQCR